MVRTLPGDVVAALRHGSGLVTTADLGGAGTGRRGLSTLLRRRLLVAVAKGVYSATALTRVLDEWALFALWSRAFTMAAPGDAMTAGWSAIALNDLPHLGRPPAVPDVIRGASPPRGSDRSPRGRTRFVRLDPDWVVRVGGVTTVAPAVAAVDVGRRAGRLATLIVADAIARLPGGCESMAQALEATSRWPGIGRSRWAVAHADADCESPLETIGRYSAITAGLPAPASNVWLGIDGPRFRVDHYWEGRRLALEGDGLHKYRALAGPAGPDGVLLAERDREFEMRGWGVMTERYTWRRALRDPRSVSDRCAAVLAGPVLPAHPGLRCWPAAVGYRLRGMPVPKAQLAAGPGWQERVSGAILRLFG